MFFILDFVIQSIEIMEEIWQPVNFPEIRNKIKVKSEVVYRKKMI